MPDLWRADDAKLLKLDAESRFTTNTGGSKLRMTKPFVEYDSQRHRLLGLLNGTPIFAVEALTEGEVHDLREVGFQLSDNERDIAATAAAITHWHRMEPLCPRCGGAHRGDQRRVRAGTAAGNRSSTTSARSRMRSPKNESFNKNDWQLAHASSGCRSARARRRAYFTSRSKVA